LGPYHFGRAGHDIGYVRGICAGDTAEHFVIDAVGNTVTPRAEPPTPS